MNRLTIFLAFALGFFLGSPMGSMTVPARAQGNSQSDVHACVDKNGVLGMVDLSAACPSGQQSLMIKNATPDLNLDKPEDKSPDDTTLDKATLEDVNRRLAKLEEEGCAALGRRKAVAPFDVVDRSGKLIFEVIENAAGVFNGGSTPAAAIVADQSGGLFSAKNGDLRVSFGVIAPRLAGLSVSEHGIPRIEIGRNLSKSTYSLRFLSGSHQLIAGIGEGNDGRGGLVLINDGQGNQKVVMEVTEKGVGRIGVMSGSGRPIAALTEGDHATGAFYACAAGGNCSPVMVGAGTNDSGVGVVATGPGFYATGPTGAPGSFLVGKR